ncbi:glycosyltransferase [Ornithinimicrobium pekingense]|uniref:Glycosyltransferase WbpH n=1 Tax=Ornithinimicrobium pekingense TaxID=384677 RepID=A0ABQ2F9C9_9MICO|nr:glycosyltransferase [Ornithinimicrobium pekingense]GGK73534.1 glycosyltransferase WbpH [Ornithinimicrobium pekingense]
MSAAAHEDGRTGGGRRALVVTVVHHPHDARIRHRQIPALLAAGWQVTYAAPWTDYGVEAERAPEGLTTVDVRRAVGRARLAAQRSARAVLRSQGPAHDVVLLHDPELVPTTLGLRLPPVVWDVHEDTAAAVAVRPWLPDRLRPLVAGGVRGVERLAERRMALLLADEHYAARFAGPHPVVLNTTVVPEEPPVAAVPDEQGVRRVVYLGSVTVERGVHELVTIGRRLQEASSGTVRLQVIGPAHGPAKAVMQAARAERLLDWEGFVPSDRALSMLGGALAGLSTLHDIANFRPSVPTKIVEYLAQGVPVISTPLPTAVDLVERSGGGVLVPFQDVEETVEQALAWAQDPASAQEVGRRGHAFARAELDWTSQAPAFVRAMEAAADGSRRGGE